MRAYIPVLAALGLEVVAMLAGRPIVEATGVVVNTNPSVIASVVIPFLLLALVLWLLSSRPWNSQSGQAQV